MIFKYSQVLISMQNTVAIYRLYLNTFPIHMDFGFVAIQRHFSDIFIDQLYEYHNHIHVYYVYIVSTYYCEIFVLFNKI